MVTLDSAQLLKSISCHCNIKKMGTKRYNKLKLFVCALIIIIQHNAVVIAMVLEAPLHETTHTPSTITQPTTPSSSTNKRFKIRHTNIDDISAISTMLALEGIGTSSSSSSTTLTWNQNMQLLRAKSIFDKQLSYRLATIEKLLHVR